MDGSTPCRVRVVVIGDSISIFRDRNLMFVQKGRSKRKSINSNEVEVPIRVASVVEISSKERKSTEETEVEGPIKILFVASEEIEVNGRV